MTYHRPSLLAVLLVGGLAATASPAWAAELLDDDALKVDLSALAEVGISWRGPDQAAAQSSPRTRLRMARAAVKGTWRDRGALKLSVEGSSGAVELLDLAMEVTPTAWSRVSAGRFKVPVSREFLVPAAEMMFSNRALLLELAPRRATGVEVAAHGDASTMTWLGSVGLFQPGSGVLRDRGQRLVARAEAEVAHHFFGHVAVAEHVFAQNRFVDTSVDPAEPRRVVEFDRLVDVALGYHDEHLHVLAEALVSLDGPDEDATAWAAHASAGYRVDVESVEVEPALAYDVIDAHHEMVHRGALALNTYWLGTDIMTTAEYEVEVPDHEVVHTVSVLLQLGF